jgi:hypothetical protein
MNVRLFCCALLLAFAACEKHTHEELESLEKQGAHAKSEGHGSAPALHESGSPAEKRSARESAPKFFPSPKPATGESESAH